MRRAQTLALALALVATLLIGATGSANRASAPGRAATTAATTAVRTVGDAVPLEICAPINGHEECGSEYYFSGKFTITYASKTYHLD